MINSYSMLKKRRNTYKLLTEEVKKLKVRCIEKDPIAWGRFIDIISPFLVHAIRCRFVRLHFKYNEADVENMRQDILLSLWRDEKLVSIRDDDKFVPWIWTYSSNAVSDHVRQVAPTDSPNAHCLSDPLVDPRPSPFHAASNSHLEEAIDRALELLNDREKIIIKLSFLHEKRYVEIAQILNIPLGTVLGTAKRARDKLKKRLKKYVIK